MKKLLFLVSCLLLTPIMVSASGNATINVTASKTNVSVGDTISVNVKISSNTPIGYYTYTLDYNPNKLNLLNGSSYIVNSANSNDMKTVSKTFKFKVTDQGTNKISVKSYGVNSFSDESKLNVTVKPVTISTSNSGSTYSDNNYLSSLKVDDYSLSPSFNKNTTEYILKLDNDVDTINITAKPESDKATVSGDGEISILPGDNKITITVTSEKGNERIYTIVASAKDSKPIIVKIDGKSYTVVKNISSSDIPLGYKPKTIKIDNQNIEAIYSDITKYTLVALKDENDNIKLYIYDIEKNTYTPYNELKFEKTLFLPIKTDNKFKDFELYTETINDIDLECYKLSSSSNYCLIYGMNLKTGNTGWYSYNIEENTLQKYNDEIDDYYKEKINNTKTLVYILSGTTLVFAITTLVLAIKKTRKNK